MQLDAWVGTTPLSQVFRFESLAVVISERKEDTGSWKRMFKEISTSLKKAARNAKAAQFQE